jgi:GrpB-like predicted nucleotidyltransferase (UPF0157 family)
VPGLAAKPVIDIQVSVASLEPIAAYRDPLAAIGYTHMPHPDDSFAPFFHRPRVWPHTHHIHVVRAGGDEERRTLAFRDYLCDHADAAREYEALKRHITHEHDGKTAESREAYAIAKSKFIEQVVATAFEAGYPRGMARP